MPIYSPSIGDLARQYLGNEIDKSTSSIRKAGDVVYGVTGNTSIRDTAHKMTDTTGLRSNGRLPTPDTPEISRMDASMSGTSGRDVSKDIRANQQNLQSQQDQEWNANLKSFYPDIF